MDNLSTLVNLLGIGPQLAALGHSLLIAYFATFSLAITATLIWLLR